MGHYKANVRDLEFNLFEVFGRQEILGKGIYTDVDVEAAKDILGEVARLAENELAASLVDSDRNPPVYDPVTCSVTIPESFKKSYRAYLDGEWGRLDTPVELGGMAVPPSLRWAIAEMICGANPAVHMYGATFSFAKLLWFPARPSRRSSPNSSSTTPGTRRWSSPSPTPAPTSAPAAPRPCSSPMAPGTSTG